MDYSLRIKSKSFKLKRIVRYLEYSSSLNFWFLSRFNSCDAKISSLIDCFFAKKLLKGVYPKLNNSPARVTVLIADYLYYYDL